MFFEHLKTKNNTNKIILTYLNLLIKSKVPDFIVTQEMTIFKR